MFLASEEVEFQALVGGELPYLSQRENSSEYQWKEYGLSVKGKIKGSQGNRIRTHLDLFLKSINDQAAGSLSTSSLKSSVETEIDMWTLVGELDLHSSSTNLRETPFFVKVPIIGPFFRLMSYSNDKSKLQVWMHIKKNEG
jgi:Flp pilus assembly secretin CpaC